MIDKQRQAIVGIARSWLSTPFKNCACIKGVGVDCAQLLVSCYREAGVLPQDFVLGRYNWQHALHHSEELYLGELSKYMRVIPEAEALAGDVVMYRSGRAMSHSGIIVNWPDQIIHAVRWGVCLANGITDAAVQGRQRLFFTVQEQA